MYLSMSNIQDRLDGGLKEEILRNSYAKFSGTSSISFQDFCRREELEDSIHFFHLQMNRATFEEKSPSVVNTFIDNLSRQIRDFNDSRNNDGMEVSSSDLRGLESERINELRYKHGMERIREREREVERKKEAERIKEQEEKAIQELSPEELIEKRDKMASDLDKLNESINKLGLSRIEGTNTTKVEDTVSPKVEGNNPSNKNDIKFN